MKNDRDGWHRRSLRLKGYDYSQAGAYFITVCTQGRACLFGDIVDGDMRLTDAGGMVVGELNALPSRYPAIDLDAFVVMPNHVHGIIVITAVGAGLVPALSARLVPALAPVEHLPAEIVATPIGATTTGATTRVAPTTVTLGVESGDLRFSPR